ncbi:MAG: excinuclease ABC subunit UvrA [Xanthomonadaceae bacterium]|nr:excinuclease ABC subunit UvrA [Xanthomonadaceae bacterium]
MYSDDQISIRGARIHNLKNITVSIPREKLVVLTGPSGSGKSSLAFDTIYAEGQRRYIESLSVYARQFIDQMEKPDCDSITGLSPTISIDQKTINYNPRSTVGTVTEVYDFLRLLYSRIGKPVCYNCKKPIQSQTPQQIVDQILSLDNQTKIAILSPIIKERKGEHLKELHDLRMKGFVRVRVDGVTHDLSDDITIDKSKKHTIDVFVDRFILKDDRSQILSRLSESVELALRMGGGSLILESVIGTSTKPTEVLYSEKFACTDCGISYPEPEPRTFSFNSPMGACPSCNGLGTLNEHEETEDVDESHGEEKPLFNIVEICHDCNGARLRKESLHFFVGGSNINSLVSLPINELEKYFDHCPLTGREKMVASRIIKEISSRCSFLSDVGVGYLSLSRSAKSLSGGEAQRIRLASQIGSQLVGVTYVLDEPSIGLHSRDNHKLIKILKRLRDAGNSVLVVEHDHDTMEHSDWILDIGPGAGRLGGEIVSQGTFADIKKDSKSVTGLFLSGKKSIPVPKNRKLTDPTKLIKIVGANDNNLKNVSTNIPVGLFTCVTGISGSGKSTLIIDTLYPLIAKEIYGSETANIKIDKISGIEHFDKIIDVDQSPIGRTPRSNPSTYTGLFKFIRDLFASLPESKIRGYKPGRFSFNVKGGRCESCEGGGLKRVAMHFLPDVFVTCDTCKGSRYNRETLDIRYKGKSIADVLAMSVREALEFFDAVYFLKSRLKVLCDVGLDYINLGQSATTLSGGEAQRIKLSKELSKISTGKTLYILDEPSTGLHFEDVSKLIEILLKLRDQGNTVIVIEHNLDIIKNADWVIDMGPDGGAAGGEIIAAGTPEQVSKSKKSSTAEFLAKVL